MIAGNLAVSDEALYWASSAGRARAKRCEKDAKPNKAEPVEKSNKAHADRLKALIKPK